jgi:ABC-2 type transport system ATP-binding protein
MVENAPDAADSEKSAKGAARPATGEARKSPAPRRAPVKRTPAQRATRASSSSAKPAEAVPDSADEATPAATKQASAKTPAKAPARAPRKRPAAKPTVLSVKGLTKRFDDTLAVDHIDLEVKAGAFYGIVGPNGAGKTTTLSMITGLLRPTEGSVTVHGADVWSDPALAKRNMGVLPDRLRLFDRLTGAQLLYYAGVLRGLDAVTVRARTEDLAGAFGLHDALGRLVSDYSAGMTKKVALAAAMIHSPRLLVLDEPFESVDPVSAATVTDILKKYVASGGTVLLSSHSMDLVQRICDNVAVVVHGRILADGTMAAVRNKRSLEERFVELVGGRQSVEGLEWLHSFSD